MKNSNKIFIGGISKEITESKIKKYNQKQKIIGDLKNYFEKKFCPITDCVIMIDKDTSKKKN